MSPPHSGDFACIVAKKLYWKAQAPDRHFLNFFYLLVIPAQEFMHASSSSKLFLLPSQPP